MNAWQAMTDPLLGFADALNSRGIGTVHVTDVVDYPKYVGAYDRFRPKLQDYLAQYPDVEMIIDMHRDAATHNGLPVWGVGWWSHRVKQQANT